MNVRALWVVILSALLSSALADTGSDDLNCPSDDGIENLDQAIQTQLNKRFNQQTCYQQNTEQLTDGVVGPVTKEWIYTALKTAPENTQAEPTDGIRPIMLLEQDLAELTLNRDVIELLTALTQDDSKNSFVTVSEAKGVIEQEISRLTAENTALLAHYVDYFSPMISPFTEQILTQSTLDTLVAQGDVDAAEALKPLVGQPQKESEFVDVVANTLAQALAQESDTSAGSDEVPEFVALEKKTDEEFKRKVAEIAALGEDTESIIKKLLSFGKKLNPLGKNFSERKKDKKERKEDAEKALAALQAQSADTTTKVDPEDSYAVAKSILLAEIKKHEKSAIALKKKGKDDEAAKATFIANELKDIFFDELQRIEDNADIDKKNADNAEAQKKAKAAADAAAKENAVIAAAKQELKTSDAMTTITQASVVRRRYQLVLDSRTQDELPALDATIAACVQHLVGVSYVSEYALQQALSNLLVSLDKVSYNLTHTDSPKPTSGFACTVEKAQQAGYFANSGAEQVLIEKAIKPFLDSSLEAIEVGTLPGCTQCSEPMQGLSYGFYPYWQASEEYQQLVFPSINPALMDFSAFTHVAYYALPIDQDGQLNELLHLSNATYAQSFFKTLSTYNVKRDVIVYSNGWQSWGSDSANAVGKDSVIKKYAENHYEDLDKLHKQFEAYGGISGITFYFDHYTAQASAENILTYINQFYSRMNLIKDNATQFEIKLMLGIEGLESETLTIADRINSTDPNYFLKLRSLFINKQDANDNIFNQQELEKLVSGEIEGLFSAQALSAPMVSHILVVMNESTSRFKKLLRAQIENEFRGDNRVKALSTVVPIIGRVALTERESESLTQFQEDLAYLKYNFGGLGLWNIPFTGLTADGAAETPNLFMQAYARLLRNNYDNGNQSYLAREQIGIVGQLLLNSTIASKVDICGEVCPKRTLFVQLFIASLTINAVFGLFWRINCQARVFIKKVRPVRELLILFSLLLFFALLGCHPDWQAYSQMILGVFMSAVVLNMVYRMVSGSYEKSDEVR